MTKFPVLFKYTQKSQVNQWQIVVDEDKFYTIEGIVGGVLTQSLPTVCNPKNVGRANETTATQQAFAEAKAKYEKKLASHYNQVLTTERDFFEPMLAHSLDDHRKELFKVRTFIQPKLDGLRCINANNELKSRNGKDYVSTPHLLQNDTVLDGELYNHEFKDNFNKIVSLCKKTKPTIEDLNESNDLVEFHAYDFPSHVGVFSERYKALKQWIADHPEYTKIKLVPTVEVFNQKEIDDMHGIFLDMGYEGTIVRLDLNNYENKRSKQLLKYKDFVDDEFEIVDVIEGEGNRAGTVGKFQMKLSDGRLFKSNVKGDYKYLAKLLADKDKLIGKQATVKYFQLTPDGIPRFPYVIKIDRPAYE